jgi:Spy/CpxP family protein refolding chaperone
MKRIFAALALALTIAAPAFAAQQRSSHNLPIKTTVDVHCWSCGGHM